MPADQLIANVAKPDADFLSVPTAKAINPANDKDIVGQLVEQSATSRPLDNAAAMSGRFNRVSATG